MGEVKATLVDILIATFNRAKDLDKNLHILRDQITSANLSNEINIIISDNCSTDNTQEVVSSFKEKNPELSVFYSRNHENIGLEPNMVKIMELATSDFMLWLGDDDYLAEGYLPFVVDTLNTSPEVGSIVTGTAELSEDGSLKEGRLEEFDHLKVNKGYDGVWKYSHLGHQLSGLVMRREGLLQDYLQFPEFRTPYLFIYLLANRMLKYDSVYAPVFKTQITVFNAKDWGYNTVGLLDEVYNAYFALKYGVGHDQIGDLLWRFTVLHSYRLDMKLSEPKKLYSKYKVLKECTPTYKQFHKKIGVSIFKDYIKLFL